MTSTRKIESNKKNASRSTGPRTPGGKLRSRHNSRRHGLATKIEDDPEAKGKIKCLTAILAEDSSDFERMEQARILAECYFDLRRIRAVRSELFFTIDDLEIASRNDFENAFCAMDRISRYELRAISKRKKALHKLNNRDVVPIARSLGRTATGLYTFRGGDDGAVPGSYWSSALESLFWQNEPNPIRNLTDLAERTQRAI
jgi:hypothetical protein